MSLRRKHGKPSRSGGCEHRAADWGSKVVAHQYRGVRRHLIHNAIAHPLLVIFPRLGCKR